MPLWLIERKTCGGAPESTVCGRTYAASRQIREIARG
jgi:hypothetical protein